MPLGEELSLFILLVLLFSKELAPLNLVEFLFIDALSLIGSWFCIFGCLLLMISGI